MKLKLKLLKFLRIIQLILRIKIGRKRFLLIIPTMKISDLKYTGFKTTKKGSRKNVARTN
jgi:hypothetical protein